MPILAENRTGPPGSSCRASCADEVFDIPDREPGQQKDFSAVIAKAQASAEPQALEEGTIPIGFARNTVMNVADQVIEAVQSGAIERFVVMAGCAK
jgi:hydroxylamine reductase